MSRILTLMVCSGLALIATSALAGKQVARPVESPADIAAATARLKKRLGEYAIPAQLKCTKMIEIPSGGTAGGSSVGGLCEAKFRTGKPQAVMICDEDMLGHFAVSFTLASPDGSDLPAFTSANCPAGG